jgi:hypothetical protein
MVLFLGLARPLLFAVFAEYAVVRNVRETQ